MYNIHIYQIHFFINTWVLIELISLSVHGWSKNNLIFIILHICLKVLWLCIFSSAQNMILYLSKNWEKGNRQWNTMPVLIYLILVQLCWSSVVGMGWFLGCFFMNICHSITKCRVSLDNQCVSKVIDTCFIYHASITICNRSSICFKWINSKHFKVKVGRQFHQHPHVSDPDTRILRSYRSGCRGRIHGGVG